MRTDPSACSGETDGGNVPAESQNGDHGPGASRGRRELRDEQGYFCKCRTPINRLLRLAEGWRDQNKLHTCRGDGSRRRGERGVGRRGSDVQSHRGCENTKNLQEWHWIRITRVEVHGFYRPSLMRCRTRTQISRRPKRSKNLWWSEEGANISPSSVSSEPLLVQIGMALPYVCRGMRVQCSREWIRCESRVGS